MHEKRIETNTRQKRIKETLIHSRNIVVDLELTCIQYNPVIKPTQPIISQPVLLISHSKL
jgi:hypothetical protein